MLFHFFNFSPYVWAYNFLQSPLQREIFRLEKKNLFSRTTTVGEMDRLDYKGVFMHL